MNDEKKVLEWIPNVEEYNPNISKDKWLELIGNRSVFDENALVAFACIKNANVATCSDMAEEFGRVKNFYNNNVWQTGKKVHLETNCQLSERDNEEDRYWSVCCLGRYLANGRFEYKIRPELEEAFEENGVLKKVNLYKEMVDKEKEFREWMSVQINGKGEYYKSDTINSYCRALKNRPKDLNIEDKYKRSIFSYDDYWSYEDIMEKIQNAPNFNVIKNKSGRGTFSAAMNLYKDFLKNNIEKYSINQNVMNKENNDNKGNNNKIQKYIDILETNKNLILTGAPGTGKTFLAKQIAKEMGCSENEIGFVQFHPSYDYTDFVEGLRPIEKDGNIGFERKDGVFKKFCGDVAYMNRQKEIPITSVKDVSFEEVYRSLVNDVKNKIITKYQAPRGEQSIIYKDGTIYYRDKSPRPINKDNLKLLYEYFCDEKIWNLKEYEKDDYFKLISNLSDGETNTIDYIEYAWTLQVLLDRAKRHYDNEGNHSNNNVSDSTPTKYIFIIDEINRGEISKIFGELFYCIDPGYRGEKGKILTQYQNLIEDNDTFKDGFYVPENVYIIGTMNDIDRSVESMDFAFRRRFAFMEVKADENLEMLYEELDENLADKSKNRLINLNKKISEMEDDGLSSAYHIGASYFLKIKDYNGDFEKLWNYHLSGLLREYLRGMSNVEAKIKSLKVAYDNESASNN